MSTILAIDLGGTRLRAGLARPDAPAEVSAIGEWPAPQTRDDFLALISRLLEDGAADRLGLGIPGLAQRTTCRWVPNLPFLDGLDLAAALPGISIGLGNDAQLALLAEVAAGAARGMSDALLLAIGTGIGSAVLAGGRIVAGAIGGACSFGWAVANMEDAGEDVSGWLERHASGRALDRAAAGIGLSSGHDLVVAARLGEAAALEAIATPARALGTALAGAVGLLNPETIIIAGGVAEALDVLGPPTLAALRRQIPPHLRSISLTRGAFGAGAGLIGAAVVGARGEEWRQVHA